MFLLSPIGIKEVILIGENYLYMQMKINYEL